MKIYIYGNESFKKEIHQTLEHSNIKFKIDSNLEIEDINSVSKLKQAISQNPQDIYLIDDEKIIKKNSLNKKIKFLAPKDGIEEEFLLENGVADLSLDSIKEFPKYIIKKYEELKQDETHIFESKEIKTKEAEEVELDDELAMLLEKGDEKDLIFEESSEDFDDGKDVNLDDIDNFISTIYNDSKSEENHLDSFNDIVDFNDNFGLNNISYDYDDNDVLHKEEDITNNSLGLEKEFDKSEEFDFFDEKIIEDNDEDFTGLEDINLESEFDFLNEKIELKEEIKKEIKQIDESLQGDKKMDEFFELDSISEKDLLDALNYKIEDSVSKSEYKSVDLVTKYETLDVNNSNVNDLSQLISKLLTNKTLEITIKIKD